MHSTPLWMTFYVGHMNSFLIKTVLGNLIYLQKIKKTYTKTSIKNNRTENNRNNSLPQQNFCLAPLIEHEIFQHGSRMYILCAPTCDPVTCIY